MKKRTRNSLIIVAVAICLWLVFSTVWLFILTAKAKSLQQEALNVISQAKEDGWYLDDWDYMRIIEAVQNTAYIEYNLSIWNLRYNYVWLDLIEYQVQYTSNQILNKTHALKQLQNTPTYISKQDYEDKLDEAKRLDFLWIKGASGSVWYDEGIGAPHIFQYYPRGFKLVEDILVPCTYEEEVDVLYKIKDDGADIE